MTCTTEGCTAETELFLCAGCVRDLQAWIDRVPDMMEELFVTMAKLDNTRAAKSEGGNGGLAGSSTPLRENAMDKRTALALWQGANAQRLANDPHAGGYQPMLEQLIREAEAIIDLPPEGKKQRTLAETITELATIPIPAMTAKECADWLTEHTGIPFKSRQIRNWVERRGLEPVTTEGHPRYKPEDVLSAYRRAERNQVDVY